MLAVTHGNSASRAYSTDWRANADAWTRRSPRLQSVDDDPGMTARNSVAARPDVPTQQQQRQQRQRQEEGQQQQRQQQQQQQQEEEEGVLQKLEPGPRATEIIVLSPNTVWR